MAHIHLPDGIFPLWALVLWNGLAVALFGAVVYRVRQRGLETRRIALAGIAGAASFAIFQLNLPILGGVHMNLTGLIGILAGPAIGTLIVLVVNILSAVIGHGAWGLIGANTLVNAAEVIITYYAFVALVRANWDTFPAAATATIAGLGIGGLIMGAIPLVSGIQGTAIQGLDLALYMGALVALNLGVAVAEGLLTGLTVSFLTSMRPDLIKGGVDVTDETETGTEVTA
ncbi:cobalt ABC transporter permease [Halobacteriales archaeon QH_6_64_20]|jgi:cobalt/nickel transport system permease protein|nr:MAG: cobalt ABC transporter permease [Halobacteriales archaeon QH_6_64_20]